MSNKKEAKSALDNIIKKSRIHLYKPIQIAEILYHDRKVCRLNLLDLEQYRTQSRKWRDDICSALLGRVCNSSIKFQDNLFDNNAIPPELLQVLAIENRKTDGAVEAYIYKNFTSKYTQLHEAVNYCKQMDTDTFQVKHLIDLFWNQAGLKRSIDKVYEIIVYSLFSTLVDVMNLKVEISICQEAYPLLQEFEDFSKKVMNLDINNTFFIQNAHVYRVGVTNAADRGLDMYSNWGPAIQIKHLTLDIELAEEIVGSISSDKIIIVCKDAEKDIIVSIMRQIGWRNRIQSIITENDLSLWYEKALRGKYSKEIGNNLLQTIIEEMYDEFPSLKNSPQVLLDRKYSEIKNIFWS